MVIVPAVVVVNCTVVAVIDPAAILVVVKLADAAVNEVMLMLPVLVIIVVPATLDLEPGCPISNPLLDLTGPSNVTLPIMHSFRSREAEEHSSTPHASPHGYVTLLP
jgi:hypothetical protein